jgi:hypothetical protein
MHGRCSTNRAHVVQVGFCAAQVTTQMTFEDEDAPAGRHMQIEVRFLNVVHNTEDGPQYIMLNLPP